MRARSPGDRSDIDGRAGRFTSLPPTTMATTTTTTTKFTAVNGAVRPLTPPNQDSPMSPHTGLGFQSAAKEAASLWRPANGGSHGDQHRSSYDRPNDRPPIQADISDEDNTIRVARPPRKRKHSDTATVSNGGSGAAESNARPLSPRPRSQSPRGVGQEGLPKRRRSNLDIVNDWNARVEKEQQPSLHLVTEDLSTQPSENAPERRHKDSLQPMSNYRDPSTLMQPESERPARQSVDDSMANNNTSSHRDLVSSPPSETQESPTNELDLRNTAAEQDGSTSPRENGANEDPSKEPNKGANDADGDQKKRKRQFSNRTKTGCHTCRGRKKKCDERKPVCGNCQRGGFECGGYGVKRPSPRGTQNQRAVIPLQSKQPYDRPPGMSERYYPPPNPISPDEAHHRQRGYAQYPPQSDGRRYTEHLPVEPSSQRYGAPYFPSSAHSWHGPERGPPPHHGPPPPPSSVYPSDRPPAMDYHHVGRALPPPGPVQPYEPPPPLPPPPPQQQPAPLPLPPPPPSAEQWPAGPSSHSRPYDLPSAPAPTVISHSSSSSGGRGNASHMAGSGGVLHASSMSIGQRIPQEQVEKDKMLRGLPFKHWQDSTLIEDRDECKAVLDRFNAPGVSVHEQKCIFPQILQPSRRPPPVSRQPPQQQQQQQLSHQHHSSHQYSSYGQHGYPPAPALLQPPPQRRKHIGPEGSPGTHTLVSTPFTCMYGYNIHFGRNCCVEPSCFFQDAADISIGDRVIIGNNVQLLCLSLPLDPRKRNGGHSEISAGAIRIEDDVFIGAGATILPYRTIGKGAVVAAGAVVTKDVEEYSVVAGIPAERIRRNIHESGNSDRNVSMDIRDQNEKMKKHMVRYVDNGFQSLSPQM